ncbi:MAG TPA: tetratricopeptide repeat protein [Pyrinomonadaceae bacterium]|nr:tetratricopeptide repeat protein [Pyrinomonadaceae bacterium]
MNKATLLLLLATISAIAQSSTPTTQQTVSQSKEGLPSQSPELAEASRLSASVVKLYNEGKYDEAFPMAKRAVELREKVLGKDDEGVASAVLNLAEIQWARRKYNESRSLFERAVQSYQRTLGPENPRLGDILDRLALNYYALGQPAETEKLYKRSLAVREKAFGSDHSDVQRSLYRLAEFYQFQGEYKQAEPLYKRLLEIRTRTNANAESIAEAVDRYACLLRKEKRAQEADQLEGHGISLLYPGEDSGQFIMGGVVNGRALNLVTPPYPVEARASRESGKVTVRVLINESGDVIRACAIEGPKLLTKASESAAARSKFSPTTLDGKPVKVNGVIIYNYVAQ